MATQGLAKIVLYSMYPEAASAFYARATGLSFEHITGTRRYEAVSPLGLTFVVDLALEPLSRGRRETALSFVVTDVEGVTMRMREDGIDVGPILERPNGKLAALRDPDGRDVDLFEPRASAEPAVEAPKVLDKPAMFAPPPPTPTAADAPAPPPLFLDKPKTEPPPPPSVVTPPALVAPPPPPPPIPLPGLVPPPPLPDVLPPPPLPELVSSSSSQPITEPPPPPMVEPPPLVALPALIEANAEAPEDKPADAATQAQEKANAEERKDVKTEPPPPPGMVGAPGPIVTAARPAKISVLGGIKISLYGANFAEGARVLVDGDDCTKPRRIDDFTIEIESPAHAAGTAEIVIENPDGQRAVISVVYAEGPIIERFSPLEGSPRGGTEVIVEGRNFEEGCRITFFSNRAPEVVFESEKRIRFLTPPQEELFHGEVRVTNLDGLGATANELFTYRLATPHVHAVSPNTGLVGGDKRVVVTGVDLHRACVARLGGKQATINWKNAETIELVTPRASEPGAALLEIENPDGQIATLENAFTYEPEPTPPLLVEIKPSRGYCAGGLTVRLIGDNFEADTIVRFGEVRAISRLVSRYEIDAELPPRQLPGPVAIELVDKHGVVVRREDGFVYESRPAPRVDAVTPRNGPMIGGTKLMLEGEFFDEHTYVRIGGQAPKRLVFRSGTSIEIIAPPSRLSGFVDVEVGRGDAGLSVAKNAYRYDPVPAPTIESVAPNKGGVDGGTEVSIEGKNFVADSSVLFGGKPAAKVKFVSATTLEVKTPPGKNGDMVDVVVRNPDGKESVSKRAFMYDARYRG